MFESHVWKSSWKLIQSDAIIIIMGILMAIVYLV